MVIILLILLVLTALFFLAIRGRSGHPKLHTLRGWSYAHRGLHGEGKPENSMAAFQAALEGGYGIEFDVHLLSDGGLAVIHDSLLERTTGQPGKVEELTVPQLKDYHLEGTDQVIPTFQQVLSLYDGKYPLVIELKAAGGNHAALSEAVCRALEGYRGDYCLESFDPRCLVWLKKNRPELLRGQLTENYFASKSTLPFYLKWILANNLSNFLTRPDFIAYRYSDRHYPLSNRFCLKQMAGVSWTIQTQEEFDTAVAEGWIPIFEGFRPDPARRTEN